MSPCLRQILYWTLFELFSEKKNENKSDSFIMPYKNTFISIVELRKVIQHPLW